MTRTNREVYLFLARLPVLLTASFGEHAFLIYSGFLTDHLDHHLGRSPNHNAVAAWP